MFLYNAPFLQASLILKIAPLTLSSKKEWTESLTTASSADRAVAILALTSQLWESRRSNKGDHGVLLRLRNNILPPP